MSACCLAPPTYELLPPGSDEAGLEARRKVRELYKRLCLDDTPMVRRRVPNYILEFFMGRVDITSFLKSYPYFALVHGIMYVYM